MRLGTSQPLLDNFLVESKNISFGGCMMQLYFFSSFLCTECVFLAVMTSDCYVAICNPLSYSVIMNHKLCMLLATGSWLKGFFTSMLKAVFISQMSFCGSNIIKHFLSDISPLLNISCADMRVAGTVNVILALLILLVPHSVTIISYICIISTILHVPMSQSRKKAFFTCVFHLAVVIIFFSGSVHVCLTQKNAFFDFHKLVSTVFTTVYPMLSPFIYCQRNQEVREALKKSSFLGR